MKHEWAIGPSIGVARVGNSPKAFYVEPERAGALPIHCSEDGNVERADGRYRRVEEFKDDEGRIKRQAARFRVFKRVGDEWKLPDEEEIQDISWTVHLANKKACWYEFRELRGNRLYRNNAYADGPNPVPQRNAGEADRRSLIVDFGPRTVAIPGDVARFEASSVPQGYQRNAHFPKAVRHGQQIKTLGEIRLNDAGELLVLGGFGCAGGVDDIQSFAGADTWHDDIADGSVTCTLTVDGETVELTAWCIVGSPKFAPEIVNIVTLADTMEDVAVRHLGYRPGLYDPKARRFDPAYVADFERDIRPILERPAGYRWVANVPALQSVSPPPFCAQDKSDAAKPLREAYLGLFRLANPDGAIDPSHDELVVPDDGPVPGFPLMPLNSGTNSLDNEERLVDKFLSLTQLQHFMLGQWAKGKFEVGAAREWKEDPASLTLASMGNCVGAPFCPGIEVTWTTRDRQIYDRPFGIRHRYARPDSDRKIDPDHDSRAVFFEKGLDPDHDETDPDAAFPGCEPGDLTKRMAVPWQADFFQCSAQFINFSEAHVNNEGGIPKPPTYYAYWWPPQSPWHVITGDTTADAQAAAGTPAGFQVLFTRGIDSFGQMLSGWHYMGFVLNRSQGALRDRFPYFTEQDRQHDAFLAASYAVGHADDVLTGANGSFSNAWVLLPPREPRDPGVPPKTNPVTFATSRRHGRSLRGRG